MTLKISDREKALPQVYELVKQLGGKIMREERNVLLASLPVGSLSEFEKGLVQLRSPMAPQRLKPQKDEKESLNLSGKAKRGEIEGSGKESAIDQKGFIAVRILLQD